MINQKKAYLLAVCAILLWATAATAFKLTLTQINYLQLLFASSLVATIASFFLLLFSGKIALLGTMNSSQLLSSLLLGLLNPFAYYLVLFRAYELLPAQIAQPLNFLWPIIIVLFSVPLLKQKLKFRHLLALLISFIGVLVISSQGRLRAPEINLFGVGLALFSTIIWALFFVINVRDQRDEYLKLFLSFGFGCLFSLLLFLASGQSFSFSPAAIWGCIFIGLAEMAITFAIWIKALKLSRTTAQVNSLIYLTPFLSLIVIGFVLKEQILLSTVLGLLLIVSGILLQER
ncbi:MAG: DMT family transporter [Candidatus Cloacimonadales bacterium]